MNVVAFNASPRSYGNTAAMCNETLQIMGENMVWLLDKIHRSL